MQIWSDTIFRKSLSARRAWIEIISVVKCSGFILSLSARRAWIEIQAHDIIHVQVSVALRKESVDRNIKKQEEAARDYPSLSARRAWIEIHRPAGPLVSFRSLSARRAWIEISALHPLPA